MEGGPQRPEGVRDTDERTSIARPDSVAVCLAAVLAVLLLVVVPNVVAIHRVGGRIGPVPDPDPSPDRVQRQLNVFGLDRCPAAPATNRTDRFPTGPLRSIRFCAASPAVTWAEPLDGLVNDPDGLVRALRDVGASHLTCGPHHSLEPSALQVTTRAGRVTTVVGTPCTQVHFYGRSLDFATLDLYVRLSLRAQRAVLTPPDLSPIVGCLEPSTRVEVRPTVERIAGGWICHEHVPSVLTSSDEDLVQAAWSAAIVVRRQGGCAPEPHESLMLSTNFGDVLRARWDGCRHRWWLPWQGGEVLLPELSLPGPPDPS